MGVGLEEGEGAGGVLVCRFVGVAVHFGSGVGVGEGGLLVLEVDAVEMVGAVDCGHVVVVVCFTIRCCSRSHAWK